MGLRIRVSDKGTLSESMIRGAGFEDAYKGEATWIEIVETSPVEALEALLAVIGDLVDVKNVARSLTHPLNSAIAILGDGNTQNDKAAINMLGAFVNKWRRSGARRYRRALPMS